MGTLFLNHHLLWQSEGKEAEETRVVSIGHVQHLCDILQDHCARPESVQTEEVVFPDSR